MTGLSRRIVHAVDLLGAGLILTLGTPAALLLGLAARPGCRAERLRRATLQEKPRILEGFTPPLHHFIRFKMMDRLEVAIASGRLSAHDLYFHPGDQERWKMEIAPGVAGYETAPRFKGLKTSLRFTYYALNTIRYIRFLARVIADSRPDLLHVHDPLLDAVVAIVVGRAAGIPVSLSDVAMYSYANRDCDLIFGSRFLSGVVNRWTVRHADFIISLQRDHRAIFRDLGARDGKIIDATYPVYIREFVEHEKSRAPSRRRDGVRTVLYFGRLEREKYVEDVVLASEAVHARCGDVRFLIIGRGSMKESLMTTAARLSSAAAIEFIDFLPRNELASYVFDADVHVVPTGGGALDQACYSGRPVVTYDRNCWHHDLIAPMDGGYVARFHEIGDLAAGIVFFLENEEEGRRQGEIARSRVKRRHENPAADDSVAAAFVACVQRLREPGDRR